MKKARVVFFGTPEFAVPSLRALINAPWCEVLCAATQPDKPIGRHHATVFPSPVKKIAQEAGIKVHDGPLSALDEMRADVGVLVAFGRIIPPAFLDAFPKGIVNIHPSLLPKYRGSSPIQAAILNRDPETGITLMVLDEKLDHGPIIAQKRTPLSANETAGELHDRLAHMGAQLLLESLPHYLSGAITAVPQERQDATYTKKLSKASGIIDWKLSLKEIDAHIRAMNPWPGAWTMWNGKRLIIWTAHMGNSRLSLDEVQLEGKKRIPYTEFKKGYPNFYLSKIIF